MCVRAQGREAVRALLCVFVCVGCGSLMTGRGREGDCPPHGPASGGGVQDGFSAAVKKRWGRGQLPYDVNARMLMALFWGSTFPSKVVDGSQLLNGDHLPLSNCRSRPLPGGGGGDRGWFSKEPKKRALSPDFGVVQQIHEVSALPPSPREGWPPCEVTLSPFQGPNLPPRPPFSLDLRHRGSSPPSVFFGGPNMPPWAPKKLAHGLDKPTWPGPSSLWGGGGCFAQNNFNVTRIARACGVG